VAALVELITGHDSTTLTGTIAIAQRSLSRIRRPQ
jgi:hypothetical protein